jgi:hypothetical protein
MLDLEGGPCLLRVKVTSPIIPAVVLTKWEFPAATKD